MSVSRSPETTPIFKQLRSEANAFADRWAVRRSQPVRDLRQFEAFAALLACLGILLVAATLDAAAPAVADRLGPNWRSLAEIVTRIGLSGYIFAISATIVIIALLSRGRRRGKLVDAEHGLIAGRAFFIVVVNAVAGILSQLAKHLFGRARPRLMDGPFHFDLFSIKASLASFPSGHSVTAFVTASALGLFMPRLRIPLYLIAIAVAFSRLILMAHYPSDVLGGAALGFGTTWFLSRAFARRRIVFVLRGGRVEARGKGVTIRALRRVWRATL